MSFKKVSGFLVGALENHIPYYTINHLGPNPDKTQLCAFHLRNREASR